VKEPFKTPPTPSEKNGSVGPERLRELFRYEPDTGLGEPAIKAWLEHSKLADLSAPAPVALTSKQVGGDHYSKLTIQPWAAMKAWMTPAQFKGYLLGNVIKYCARDKNGVEDLEKAKHYLEMLIEESK
jgi:hypothetical protein